MYSEWQPPPPTMQPRYLRHYDASSECANVSIHEVACYQIQEGTDPPIAGESCTTISDSVPRGLTQKKKEVDWGEGGSSFHMPDSCDALATSV